jgi:exodeoxyribonuclease V gamma subunit
MVVESGIRWGIDAEDRQQAGQSPDIQNTFAFGLDRLALGVVMADEGLAIHLAEDGGGLTPWDAAEQAETLTLLGRFFDFSEALSASIRALQTPRTLLEWVTTITEPETGVLDRLTRTEGVSEWLSLRVRTELSELAAEAKTAQSTQTYRLDTLQALLTGRFEIPSGMSRQQTGAITCCALRPMRSVPYRVVCMIGMDEGQFPKQATLPGFDWTGLSPRAGDKIPRDEDRLMLLEAILSARSHLVISYTGRSVRTNEACQPCVPIAELQEVIDKSFSVETARPAESLLTAHALHNFSPENFASTQGRPPRSFDCRLMAAAQAGLRPRTDPTFLPLNGPIPHARREPDTVIDLETLADFFSNPARALLKQRFGLRLREYSVEVEDQVPVELSGPDRRRIQRDLMARTLVQMAQLGEDLTEQTQMSDWLAPVVDHMRAAGGLPPGPAGRHVLAPQLSVLEHLCETCEDLLTTQPSSPSVRIPLTIQGRKIEVVGQTHQIRDGAMTIFVPRADSAGSHMWWLIQPWIELIAGIASDPDAPKKLGVVHAYDKDGEPKLQFRVFGPDWPAHTAQVQAQALLAWMVECHQAGMDRPLAIYPQTSFQFASAIHKWNRTEDQDMPIGPESFEPGQDPPPKDALKDAMQRAKKAWGGPDSRSGDSHEVHIGHLYGNARPYLSTEHPYPPMPDRHFAHHALRLWLPIIASRELISGGKKAMSNFVAALAPEGSS